ncbi:MAG: TonB-dependent receptor plug domain-containing protein [Terrimonas sp.]|nr:TonB-dependent receptor plug domain-containing protein [Terrimonas sp.]
MLKRIIRLLSVLFVLSFSVQAQETNSSIGGVVLGSNNQALVGATITAIHVPTGTKYIVIARSNGRYDISNMTPGGPYTITATFVGFTDEKRENVFLSLGEKSAFNFVLADKSGNLTELVLTARRAATTGQGGSQTSIGRDKVANIPTVSRSLNDYLRVTPQAKITGDGGISIAGQNNRYNSFFIDGAINNDVFGLAASGTNGGQASINPISIDAIDQFQVVLSPFDASLGGFTGGGINATTRSGTNELQGSAWYYYRDEQLAGKTPGSVPVSQRVKLDNFKNETYGLRFSGPLIKNKLFFFILGEMQRDQRPQPFNFNDYRGLSTMSDVDNLVTQLQTRYGYDAGGYLDNPEQVKANRITTKLDWNLGKNNRTKLSLSYRYNQGERYNTSASSSTTINFFNNGILFPSKANTGTAELRTSLKRGASNRLLVTYTDVIDNRDPIGQRFPRVTINDGSGRLVFGTENFSTGNYLSQKNWTFNDAFKFYLGNNLISVGTDNLISKANNLFIRDLYGNYTYNSMSDFLNDATPAFYSHTYSNLEEKTDETNSKSAAKFNYLNLAFFINDEIKANQNLTLNFGIRADKTVFQTTPNADPFFNDTAIAAISQYYDLRGARSGQISKVPWSISPRFGFTLRIPEENSTIRGGIGLFTGRMPLVWPGGVYNNTGINLGSVNQSTPGFSTYYSGFRPDPLGQYTPADFNTSASSAKGQVDLMAAEFKLPKLLRTTLSVEKRFMKGWTLTVEGLLSKNINEIYYQNVNIIPPALMSAGPGARTVYSFSGTPSRIGLLPGGGNPYGSNDIFLLYNNDNKKRRGFSYNLTAIIEKSFSKGWSGSLSYTYGNSIVTNEGTSSQNNSQWRFMETVNGRNFLGLSTSDFDLGHRFYGYLSKKFVYGTKKMAATTITLVYNGQQGSPFSWVYQRSMVGDRGRSEGNDLMYIPTASEIKTMTFLSTTVNGVTFTQADQRLLLENYITGSKYLNKHRGQFAERNGDRLPWSHLLDLSLKQDFSLRMGKKVYSLQLTYDIYNFTNFLNRNWGKTYFLSNDQYGLFEFNSYTSSGNLTPRYIFRPQTGTPWSLSTSTAPGLSARWLSQVGVRLSF